MPDVKLKPNSRSAIPNSYRRADRDVTIDKGDELRLIVSIRRRMIEDPNFIANRQRISAFKICHASYAQGSISVWPTDLTIGATLPSIAQSISGSLECGSVVQWRSTCERPLFDLDAKRGQSGVRMAQMEFNAYQSCLRREASDDDQAVTKGIFAAAQNELRLVEESATIWSFSIR